MNILSSSKAFVKNVNIHLDFLVRNIVNYFILWVSLINQLKIKQLRIFYGIHSQGQFISKMKCSGLFCIVGLSITRFEQKVHGSYSALDLFIYVTTVYNIIIFVDLEYVTHEIKRFWACNQLNQDTTSFSTN